MEPLEAVEQPLVPGVAMAGCIVLGVAAIRRRDTAGYRAWMARGHAIGPGACTWVPTFLPWALLVGQPSGHPRVLLVLAGRVPDLAATEWALRWRPTTSSRAPGRLGVTPVADRVG